MSSVFKGPVFVVRDNIDTDQIIPAQYLNLVPTIPEEYEKLGSYAMIGLPDSLYPTRYVAQGEPKSAYPIIVGTELRLRQFPRACADRAWLRRVQTGFSRELCAYFFPQLRGHRRVVPVRHNGSALRCA